MPGYPSRCEGYLATHHWSLNFQNITNEHSLSTRTLFRVHPRFGVVTVWRGIMTAVAGVGYRLLARRSAGASPGRAAESVSWGGCEGRHMAGTCGDLMGRAGRGLAGHFPFGARHQCRHTVGEACCRRGGVAGAEPPHKGGPNRPDRPTAVVSSQWSEKGLTLTRSRSRDGWGSAAT